MYVTPCFNSRTTPPPPPNEQLLYTSQPRIRFRSRRASRALLGCRGHPDLLRGVRGRRHGYTRRRLRSWPSVVVLLVPNVVSRCALVPQPRLGGDGRCGPEQHDARRRRATVFTSVAFAQPHGKLNATTRARARAFAFALTLALALACRCCRTCRTQHL